MSSQFIGSRGARWLAAVVAALVSVWLLAVPANAEDHKSRAVIFAETPTGPTDPLGGYSGDPANAIIDGWWGHEGADGAGSTNFSADFRDQAAFFQAMGITDWGQLGIAYVPASKDGSAETPTVKKGDLAGEAFKWFSLAPAFGSIIGTPTDDDFVDTVSTQAEWDDWVSDGKPALAFDAQLNQIKALDDGAPKTKHPSGKSILNRWAAGQDISLVYFVIDDWTVDGEPIVKVGPDRRAITAWMTFRTVANSKHKVQTSAGYHVTSDIPGAPAGSGSAGSGGATAGDAPSGSSGTDSSAETPGTTGSDATGDAAKSGDDESWTSTSSAKAVGGVVILLVIAAVVVVLRPRRRGGSGQPVGISPTTDGSPEAEASPTESTESHSEKAADLTS